MRYLPLLLLLPACAQIPTAPEQPVFWRVMPGDHCQKRDEKMHCTNRGNDWDFKR